MQRAVAVLILLSLAVALPAQSVTISQTKLDELMAILQVLDQIPPKLDRLQTSFDTRTTALETGFAQYRQVVEEELLPRAKAQEKEIFWLKIGIGALAAALLGLGIYAVAK